MSKQPSTRYDGVLPEHTHDAKPGDVCKACEMINAEMTPEQNAELVNVLMQQFDDMIDHVAGGLKKFGHDKVRLLFPDLVEKNKK